MSDLLSVCVLSYSILLCGALGIAFLTLMVHKNTGCCGQAALLSGDVAVDKTTCFSLKGGKQTAFF